MAATIPPLAKAGLGGQVGAARARLSLMRRALALLTLILGFTLLAAHPASAVASLQAENRASGLSSELTSRIENGTRLSEDAIRENILPAYDVVSDDAVAARGVGREIGILRDAARGKGNFGLGSGTRAEAEKLGRAWVGEGYEVASDGKTLVGADGLRQFRPPSLKPSLGIEQANFERRLEPSGQWFGNGHLDVGP